MADNTARQDQLRHDTPDDSVSAIGFPAGATDIRDEFDAVVSQIRKIIGDDWRTVPSSNIVTIAAHLTDLNNPHVTSLGNLGSGFLAQLNAVIIDATLDDITGTRDPNAHAGSHQNGGVDEINVGGLSGALADPQAPTTHATRHESGGVDELDMTGLTGLLATSQNPVNHAVRHITGASDEVDGDQLNVDWNPTNYTPILVPETSSLDDLSSHLAGIDAAVLAPVPGVHAATHANGGVDEVSVTGLSGLLADSQVPLLHVSTHQNGGVDEISVTGLSGLLADAQTPLGHTITHVRGGSDEVDGDILDIDFTPTNYTPDTTPPEVTNVDELSSHLAGIDNKLGEPTMVNILDTAVAEGNNSITGSENKILIKRVRVETSSVNWTLTIYSRDDYLSDPLVIFENRTGDWELEIDIPYEDKDTSQEFHYSFNDMNGANTHDIEIWAVKL